MNRFVFALVLLLLAAGAHAHDLWVERCEGGYVLLNGHVGTEESPCETVEYLYSDIIRILCFDGDGTGSDAEAPHEVPVRIEGRFAAVHVLMSPGYWSETPFETKNLPKDKAGSSILTWLTFESVIRIDEWGDGVALPLTDGLEIIPLKDPLSLSRGKKVRLVITMNGKPVAGVPVAYFDSTRGVTDSSGRINIRLGRDGMQLIKASLTLPGDSIKTDEIRFNAALVFDIDKE